MAGHDRILGIDYGTKRIGLAVSDPLGTTALPLTSIDISAGWRKFMVGLDQIIGKYQPGHIVIGNPKTLNNKTGVAAENVRAFADKLRQSLTIAITLWDERLSTQAVERILIEKGLSREQRREQIDAEAAAFILQGYLDAHKTS